MLHNEPINPWSYIVGEVDAVKTREGIAQVELLLRKHFGVIYGDIWKLGINVALRISDLLDMKFDDIDLINGVYRLREGKTKKSRTVELNHMAIEIIQRRRQAQPTDIYLFQTHSNRTASLPPKPLSRVTVAKRFKEVGEMPTVAVKLGTHSMRKTRGWALHSDGVPIEKIAKLLNHNSTSTTMTYLGITHEDVMKTYHDYVL